MENQELLEDFSKLSQGLESMKAVEDTRKDLQTKVEELQLVEEDKSILRDQIENILGKQLLHSVEENFSRFRNFL